jgi:hypothetical protein
MDSKLVSSLPTLDNQNNLDPELQSVPVIMTNPDDRHYNQPLRLISPLAERNTNNPNSSLSSIQPIESGTNMRNIEHKTRSQFGTRKRNNLDDEENE